MSSTERESAGTNHPDAETDATTKSETRGGQMVEEEEKNLSRHTTRDSSPSIEEQTRTTIANDES
jgi:hypothetical protein